MSKHLTVLSQPRRRRVLWWLPFAFGLAFWTLAVLVAVAIWMHL